MSAILLGVCSLMFSYQVLANSLGGPPDVSEYSGSGIWKTIKGGSGEYTTFTRMERFGNALSISDTVTANGVTFKLTTLIVETDDTFLDVYDEGVHVGSGYRFQDSKNKMSRYHTESDMNGWHYESTMNLSASRIQRIGSKTKLSTGEKIIWKDNLAQGYRSYPQCHPVWF